MRILVTGAGGFIGSHLVKRLKEYGHFVRAADIKAPEFATSYADDQRFGDVGDCRHRGICAALCDDIDQVYHLAADMGGIGYISANHAIICRNSTRINLNMLEAAYEENCGKFLFSSSACVYNQNLQGDADVQPLKESDAWPALPEEGYGLEKLYMEKLCQFFHEDYGLKTYTVRFHNVYGPYGTYDGGKEKAPAALCRKIAQLPHCGGELEVWGDGEQTRSFMYIDDCVEGLMRLMASDYHQPLNLGSDELTTINDLAARIFRISGKTASLRHLLDKPQGVRGRNSDNSKLREVLGWEPTTLLDTGLVPTYDWINRQVHG